MTNFIEKKLNPIRRSLKIFYSKPENKEYITFLLSAHMKSNNFSKSQNS